MAAVSYMMYLLLVITDGHLLAGVQNGLKHNVHVQRLGQKAAEDVELDAIRRQSNYRVEVSSQYELSHHLIV